MSETQILNMLLQTVNALQCFCGWQSEHKEVLSTT